MIRYDWQQLCEGFGCVFGLGEWPCSAVCDNPWCQITLRSSPGMVGSQISQA